MRTCVIWCAIMLTGCSASVDIRDLHEGAEADFYVGSRLQPRDLCACNLTGVILTYRGVDLFQIDFVEMDQLPTDQGGSWVVVESRSRSLIDSLLRDEGAVYDRVFDATGGLAIDCERGVAKLGAATIDNEIIFRQSPQGRHNDRWEWMYRYGDALFSGTAYFY
jgi:hypothetical protein